MLQPALNWLRTRNDPLRNVVNAEQWIAALPVNDVMAVQKEALDLVAAFPGVRTEIATPQVEALLKVDARLEQVIAQLTAQYTANYQKSSAIESRLWHAVFDLVKAFTTAYGLCLKAGYPSAENKHWRAVLPWVLVRLAHYKGLDGRYRLFRYGHWIPAQWREFHELYEFARMRGWQREQLVFGAGGFGRPGVCVEHVYLQTLLLMRLDSGNFTPDQVDWVSRQLEDWSPSLTLVPPPGTGANFYVDLTGNRGLRRQDKPSAGGRILFLDTGPIYSRVVERMRWLPEQDDGAVRPGELPVREQRLLLMRLASLFGPEAIAQTPRAPRFATETEVRVVTGLSAVSRAIAEIDRLPDAARTPGVSASFDEITQTMNTNVNPESVARKVRGGMWRMVDRSETGCRLACASAEAPQRLGELVAIRENESWILAVVRRMQRHQVDEVTVGVEIIARRLVRVLLRSWATPTDGGRSGADRPFFGVYLPAHPENRQASQRSLIGPDERFVTGTMVELDTGNARYLIRFTQTMERQAGWAWTLFSAVRKLSP
ncbi:MAG TPA: hypothetical protein VLW08_11575 [Casimicrobiaceae bacterium]|jgi:hypothetical protein|nr:hypothetical protein [Casimicrobiaceae bacterium]